jgi:hypothetical protein
VTQCRISPLNRVRDESVVESFWGGRLLRSCDKLSQLRLLVYCSDFRCSHLVATSADQWPDDLRLSDL